MMWLPLVFALTGEEPPASQPAQPPVDAQVAKPEAPAVIKLSGWFLPTFGLTYRPNATPRDRFAYGVGFSQAGLMVSGDPFAGWKYMLHLVVTGDAELLIEEATVTWAPTADISVAIGRMRIPYTVQSFSAATMLMFPQRSGPNEVFLTGTDLGAVGTFKIPSAAVTASVGVWNGTSKEVGGINADSRGLLLSARVDWTLGGDFPFEEGDLSRGPLRFGLGAAVLYRPSLTFDMAGFEGPAIEDLRLNVSLRLAVRGFFLQAEGLRRQTTDDLSGVTRGATGAYVQTSYFGIVGPIGLSPIARVGWAQQDEGFNPRTTQFLEVGLALYPRPLAARPESLRILLEYQAEMRITEGEDAHRFIGTVQLMW